MLAGAFNPAGHDVGHAQDCISANTAGSCIRIVHHIDHFSTHELAACHERAIVDPFAHVCVSAAVAAELLDGWGVTAEVNTTSISTAAANSRSPFVRVRVRCDTPK